MHSGELFVALMLFGVVGAYYNYNKNNNYNSNSNNVNNANKNYPNNGRNKNGYNSYTHTANKWGYDRRPRIMTRLPMKALLPTDRNVQQKIVSYHNHFRSSVKPVASDMLLMRWHPGCADAAQRWADTCQHLVHDSPTGRYVDSFGTCGQNIFVSSHKVPWYFAIETWFLEKKDFSYGYNNNSLAAVGHYTQMVWGSTHKVGCGMSKCYRGNQVYYNYVCNYCPTGNYPETLSKPYKKGKSCGSCRNSCQGRLCTNSCPWADLWANCNDLYETWPQWLCKSPGSAERRQNCKATCFCKNRIK